jgi:hypothetical protein
MESPSTLSIKFCKKRLNSFIFSRLKERTARVPQPFSFDEGSEKYDWHGICEEGLKPMPEDKILKSTTLGQTLGSESKREPGSR